MKQQRTKGELTPFFPAGGGGPPTSRRPSPTTGWSGTPSSSNSKCLLVPAGGKGGGRGQNLFFGHERSRAKMMNGGSHGWLRELSRAHLEFFFVFHRFNFAACSEHVPPVRPLFPHRRPFDTDLPRQNQPTTCPPSLTKMFLGADLIPPRSFKQCMPLTPPTKQGCPVPSPLPSPL